MQTTKYDVHTKSIYLFPGPYTQFIQLQLWWGVISNTCHPLKNLWGFQTICLFSHNLKDSSSLTTGFSPWCVCRQWHLSPKNCKNNVTLLPRVQIIRLVPWVNRKVIPWFHKTIRFCKLSLKQNILTQRFKGFTPHYSNSNYGLTLLKEN